MIDWKREINNLSIDITLDGEIESSDLERIDDHTKIIGNLTHVTIDYYVLDTGQDVYTLKSDFAEVLEDISLKEVRRLARKQRDKKKGLTV